MRYLGTALALTFLVAADAAAEDKPVKKTPVAAKTPAKDETIDDIMGKAQQPPPDDKPASDPKVATDGAKPADKPVTDGAKPVDKAAAKPADGKPGAKVATAKTKPDEPPPPPTDDNDTTGEATRPVALEAVRPVTQPRRTGAYELGALDCRMLDGAGIERILPKKITAGEEPDLLCRVLVTQPATVLPAPHELTLTVTVGPTATYQQVRTVRVSSVGRRALVFVVPADRISSEDAARVTMRVMLSAPAKPAVREVKFVVEPAD